MNTQQTPELFHVRGSSVKTKEFYDKVYERAGHDYGAADNREIPSEQFNLIRRYMVESNISEEKAVLEIGCGLGRLHECHPNWCGIEYSHTAAELAKISFGANLNIREGDARNLPIESESIDFLFSFAALEHIPMVEAAFHEIERVLKRGGVAVLAPAWNCRSWTVKKLQQRPYRELGLSDRIGKFLIPIRENLLVRMSQAAPRRILREVRMAFGQGIQLEYKRLLPDFSLWDRYPHISDDDAFAAIDAHAALCYFCARGWISMSHPGRARRLFCRGEEIVLRRM